MYCYPALKVESIRYPAKHYIIGFVNVRSGQIRFAKPSAKDGIVPSLHRVPKIVNDTDHPSRKSCLQNIVQPNSVVEEEREP